MKRDLRLTGVLFKITYSDSKTSYHRANDKHGYTPKSFIRNLNAVYQGNVRNHRPVNEVLRRCFTDDGLVCEPILKGTIEQLIVAKTKFIANDSNSIDSCVGSKASGDIHTTIKVPKSRSRVLKSNSEIITFVDKNWCCVNNIGKFLNYSCTHPADSNLIQITKNVTRI